MPRSSLDTAGKARAAASASACQEDSAAGVPPGTAEAKEAKNADAEDLPDLVQPSAEAVAAAAARAAAAVAAGVTLQLTPAEEDLFSLLNQCIEEQQLNIELRAAGGWVRDKLLGFPSTDIDIAIDTTSGARFAAILNQWLVSKGEPPRSFGIISKNVAQSKHLETATLRLRSFALDLVNLRSESYCNSSRIPSDTELGTPLQDAERRDFCCNSLFYNLKTRRVEDWLGSGLRDIQLRILRASSPVPRETLAEDPLRLLRGIRFAATLRFSLQKDLAVAAADPPIRESLKAKVAKERVGIELRKIFSLVTKRSEQKLESAAETEAASTVAAEINGHQGSAALEALLEGPLNGAVRGVLLMQQLQVWETVTCLPEGHEIYRQEKSPAAMESNKARGSLKALVEHLKASQEPVDPGKETFMNGPLGASCLIALRHILARRVLLEQLQHKDSGAASAEMTNLYESLSKGLELKEGGDNLRQLLFAAVLHPVRDFVAVSPKVPRVRPLAGDVVSSAWKLPNADAAATEGLIVHSALLRVAADEEATMRQKERQQHEQQEPQQQQRVRLGLLVRQVGATWREAIALAAAEALGSLICKDTAAAISASGAAVTGGETCTSSYAEVATGKETEAHHERHRKRACGVESSHEHKKLCGQEGHAGHLCSEAAAAQSTREDTAPEVCLATLDCLLVAREEAAKETLRRLVHLKQTVEALGLQDAWQLQPLCNGKQVAHALPGASGRELGAVMDEQRLWQLANPGKSAEQCLEYLQEKFPQFREVQNKTVVA
ncbi:tRNA nucleotidyltransferase, putative [Eimeria tenella]|uniref:tRNA nucleotidyltransferase, putative n=1 Tax=Eimeria tenella TaxID=5802 RepID=U6L4X0_EIMTE|nr:tRNA nucleotidyltransferase, putative [Eimeria tenella]CDJ42825.1 tRNA nucleotidyltransferase, putative [Eimeria tenella]|eukprot:XP_013233575.1 tRNA nucleotidyltransferase, putative [Eimeria tenella]